MREYEVAATNEVAESENLVDMVFANAERFGDDVVFRRKHDGSWDDVGARQFAESVMAVAKGFIASGLGHGERVGLMSRTRYEWTLLDFALWCAGCVPVPIYETSSAEQVEWILSDSGARALVVETAAHRSVVDAVVDKLARGSDAAIPVWQIEGERPAVTELTEVGSTLEDERVHERRRGLTSSATATLVYTSGTTGRPKGCDLTHGNLLAEVKANSQAFPELMEAGNSLLLFLPLAHVLARAIALTCLYTRTTVGHTSDVKNLVADLASFRPTFVVSVPRVFEKVYNTAKQKAHSEGPGQLTGKIFDTAESVAVEFSRAQDTGGPGAVLRAKHTIFDKLVYAKLRAALGGRCVAAISGGAPLGDRLAHFFRGAGIPVFEGYGLTETCAAAFVNTRTHSRIGTVGRPVAGTSVRIADDGEVLIAGNVVFRGYWNNEQATSEAVNDGWFRTGDLGELDADGYLRVTGRKKELIVTAGGKNVAPATLEDRLRAHPLVSQAMVVGDRQPFIAALVTIDEEFFPAWKQQHSKPADASVADLVEDEQLRAEIAAAVEDANTAVSHAESIKKFRILADDFTEESGEMTPSLKLRRAVVGKKRAADIEAIYSG